MQTISLFPPTLIPAAAAVMRQSRRVIGRFQDARSAAGVFTVWACPRPGFGLSVWPLWYMRDAPYSGKRWLIPAIALCLDPALVYVAGQQQAELCAAVGTACDAIPWDAFSQSLAERTSRLAADIFIPADPEEPIGSRTGQDGEPFICVEYTREPAECVFLDWALRTTLPFPEGAEPGAWSEEAQARIPLHERGTRLEESDCATRVADAAYRVFSAEGIEEVHP